MMRTGNTQTCADSLKLIRTLALKPISTTRNFIRGWLREVLFCRTTSLLPTRMLFIRGPTSHSPWWIRMVSSKMALRLPACYTCSIWLKRRWHFRLICRHSWCRLRSIRRLRILLWETWRSLPSRRLNTPGTFTLKTTISWMGTKS